MDINLVFQDNLKSFYVDLYDKALKIPANINKIQDHLNKDSEKEKERLKLKVTREDVEKPTQLVYVKSEVDSKSNKRIKNELETNAIDDSIKNNIIIPLNTNNNSNFVIRNQYNNNSKTERPLLVNPTSIIQKFEYKEDQPQPPNLNLNTKIGEESKVIENLESTESVKKADVMETDLEYSKQRKDQQRNDFNLEQLMKQNLESKASNDSDDISKKIILIYY